MTRALLLHGNASWRRYWHLVTDRLDAPAEAPDLPGFGDAQPAAQAESQSQSDVIASWVEREPCVLVAAGAGHALALEVPDVVAAAINEVLRPHAPRGDPGAPA